MQRPNFGLLLAGLLGAAQNVTNFFTVPKRAFNPGTYGKRTRIKGKAGQPGAKLAKAIARNRLTLRGSVTGCTLWALSRGKRAV